MFWSLRPTGRMPWIIREVKHHVYVKRQTPFCVPRYQVFSLLVFYCSLFLSCRSRGGEGGLAPLPLIFRPKWGPKGEEHFFETSPSPLPLFISESGWPGPPFSGGLDLPLFLHLNYKVRAIFLSIRVVFSFIYLFISYFGEILTLNLTFAVCRIREA